MLSETVKGPEHVLQNVELREKQHIAIGETLRNTKYLLKPSVQVAIPIQRINPNNVRGAVAKLTDDAFMGDMLSTESQQIMGEFSKSITHNDQVLNEEVVPEQLLQKLLNATHIPS